MGKFRDAVEARRSPAAVADHGGGKDWRRGMAMWQQGEIATRRRQSDRSLKLLVDQI
jgi:hypothetical protein